MRPDAAQVGGDPAPATLGRFMATDPPRLAPIAILLHELEDGRSHVDLLIARSEGPFADDERVVPTWRVAARPDRACDGTVLRLEPIDDHRALYLRLTEPRRLDRGRGRVTPLRRGVAERVAERLAIRWEDGEGSIWRLATTDDLLTVERNPPERPPAGRSSAEGFGVESEGVPCT
jgi:hypothetical protein